MRFKIQTLNNISIKGLERLPRDRFEIASEIGNPDAILVRSADMHKVALPDIAARRGPRRRRHQQHPGRGALEEGHPGVQRSRRQRQRREGTGAGRHVPGRAQHLPGLGLRQVAAG